MIEFIREMTVGNVWLWFHILAGGILAKIASWYWGKRYVGMTRPIITVFLAALSWEIFELYYWGYANYSGGVMGWRADSLGDILGAVLMALVVAL